MNETTMHNTILILPELGFKLGSFESFEVNIVL